MRATARRYKRLGAFFCRLATRCAVLRKPCVLIWSGVTGLTEAERKAVHTGARSGVTKPIVCLSAVVVEQEESRCSGS